MKWPVAECPDSQGVKVMLDGYQIFDADAHTMMSPKMWADLPEGGIQSVGSL